MWSLSVLTFTERLCTLITEYIQLHVCQHTEKPEKTSTGFTCLTLFLDAAKVLIILSFCIDDRGD